jgi:hypothetical protein
MLQAIAVIRTAERITDGIAMKLPDEAGGAGASAHCRDRGGPRQWRE